MKYLLKLLSITATALALYACQERVVVPENELELSSESVEVPSDGGSFFVDVTSGGPYTVTVSGESSWITRGEPESTDDEYTTREWFTAAADASGAGREGFVIFENGERSDTLRVLQGKSNANPYETFTSSQVPGFYNTGDGNGNFVYQSYTCQYLNGSHTDGTGKFGVIENTGLRYFIADGIPAGIKEAQNVSLLILQNVGPGIGNNTTIDMTVIKTDGSLAWMHDDKNNYGLIVKLN